MYPELEQMLAMLEVDAGRVRVGRDRQAAVWRGQAPDQVPIVLGRSESRQIPERVGPQYYRLCEHQLRGGARIGEYYDFEHYTLREQFHDPRRMLIEALWDVIGWARTPSDAQLSLRPNYGVGTVATVFGCSTDMGEHDMPWVTDRPDRSRLLDVDLDRLDQTGLLPRVIEFIQLARETLVDFPEVHVFMPDLQGPMNLAFLLRQEEVFIEMLAEPGFYGRLMDLICEVFIRLSRRLKHELGEPMDGGYHGALCMSGGGVRVVDDVSIMLSGEQYEQHVLPYVHRCLTPFGGGWVHSCGDISHQLEHYLATPEIRGVNFGEPEYYDFPALMPRFAASGTFCYGGPVRTADESAEAYLRRTAACLQGARQTLIFQPRMQGQDMREGEWPAPEAILELWAEACGSLA